MQRFLHDPIICCKMFIQKYIMCVDERKPAFVLLLSGISLVIENNNSRILFNVVVSHSLFFRSSSPSSRCMLAKLDGVVNHETLEWPVTRIRKKPGVANIRSPWTSKSLAGTGSLLPRSTMPTTAPENVHLLSYRSTHIIILCSRPSRLASVDRVARRGKCPPSQCCTLMETRTSCFPSFLVWSLKRVAVHNNFKNHF